MGYCNGKRSHDVGFIIPAQAVWVVFKVVQVLKHYLYHFKAILFTSVTFSLIEALALASSQYCRPQSNVCSEDLIDDRILCPHLIHISTSTISQPRTAPIHSLVELWVLSFSLWALAAERREKRNNGMREIPFHQLPRPGWLALTYTLRRASQKFVP